MYIRGLIITPRPPRAQTTAPKKKTSPLRSKPPYKPPNRTPLPPPPHPPCNHPKESSPPPTHPPKTWSERRSDKSVDTGRPQRGHKHSRRTIIEIGIAESSWGGRYTVYKKRNNVAEKVSTKAGQEGGPDIGWTRVLGNYLSSRFNRRPVFRIGSNDGVYWIYIVVSRRSALKLPELSLWLSLSPSWSAHLSCPLFEAGYPSWSSALLHPWCMFNYPRPRGREPRWKGRGWGQARSRKTFIISCERETVCLLVGAGILKKDDVERGRRWYARGEGIHGLERHATGGKTRGTKG